MCNQTSDTVASEERGRKTPCRFRINMRADTCLFHSLLAKWDPRQTDRNEKEGRTTYGIPVRVQRPKKRTTKTTRVPTFGMIGPSDGESPLWLVRAVVDIYSHNVVRMTEQSWW
jgi:hypothetical protein